MNGRKSEGGQASLPLVLLPGTLCDARVFGPLQDRLPGVETHVVLTPVATSLQEAAKQVFVDAPEHFALLGFSLGGMIAMEMALYAPRRVRGLALVSTSPLPVPPELQPGRRAGVEEARRMGISKFLRERLWPEYRGVPERGDVLPLLEAMAESLGHAVFAQQTAVALGRTDFRARLAAVQCPVLVLAGTEDRVCPPATQRTLVAALRECDCVMLPGGGHLALLERPDEVAAAVAAWFHRSERIEASSNSELSERGRSKESE